MISQEYLNGLEDVKIIINSIINGSFIQDSCMLPEKTTTIMKKQTDHLRQIIKMFPEDNLIEYLNKAIEGENWILNQGE